MKIVIAGGTGFVGKILVAKLADEGSEVTVLARDPAQAEKSFGGRARVVGWSLEPGRVRDAWERELAEATGVVNLAGAGVMDRAWTAERKRELVASRVDVTRALAQTLARGARPDEARVFVSASAVGIYGARLDDTVLKEESPAGDDFLAELCVAWEAAAAPAADAGVRVVHPRLGIVLGKDGGALAEMVRPFRFGVGGPIGSGTQWVSWIHERDVVGGLVHALTSFGMRGTYNFAAPRPVRMEEQADAIATVLGTRARARVPAFVLKTILGSERAEVVLRGQRVSSRKLEAAGYDFAFDELLPALEDILGPR